VGFFVFLDFVVFACISSVLAKRLIWKRISKITNFMSTHTHTQPFYGSLYFVGDNPGEPVPEETFTHSHSSWWSVSH